MLTIIAAQHGEDCSIAGSQEELICISNTMCLPNGNSKACQCVPRTAWDVDRSVCIHEQGRTIDRAKNFVIVLE